MARLRSIVSISLAIEATIRLPISSRTRNASSSLWLKISAQTIRAVRVSASSTVTVRRLPWRRTRSADDVVDVQHPAGLFRADAALVQGEHGALRDDEQAAQLGEPGDHVVGERVGRLRRGAPSRRTGRRTASPRWRRGAAQRRRCRRGRWLRRPPSGAAAAARGGASRLRPGRPPRVADRRAIETLGLEQPGGRRQMLLAFADAAAPRERVQQDLVDAPVERRKLRATSPDIRTPRRRERSRRDAPAGRRGSRGSGAAAR